MEHEQSPRMIYARFAQGAGVLHIRHWSLSPFDGATAYAHAGNGSPLGPWDSNEHYPVEALPSALRHMAQILWCDCERHVVEDMVRIVTDAAQAIEARRAETAQTGSVADESAVGNADAPFSRPTDPTTEEWAEWIDAPPLREE